MAGHVGWNIHSVTWLPYKAEAEFEGQAHRKWHTLQEEILDFEENSILSFSRETTYFALYFEIPALTVL